MLTHHNLLSNVAGRRGPPSRWPVDKRLGLINPAL